MATKPKFLYKEQVLIIKGFYSGRRGEVIRVYPSKLWGPTKYDVFIEGDYGCRLIEESFLKSKPIGWREGE